MVTYCNDALIFFTLLCKILGCIHNTRCPIFDLAWFVAEIHVLLSGQLIGPSVTFGRDASLAIGCYWQGCL